MAEKRPDTIYTSSAVGGQADSKTGIDGTSAVQGVAMDRLKHVILPYITENIDDNDTFTFHDGTTYFGRWQRIVRCAWEAVDASDIVCAALDTSGTAGDTGTSQVIVFNTSGSNHNGYLHLWITG